MFVEKGLSTFFILNANYCCSITLFEMTWFLDLVEIKRKEDLIQLKRPQGCWPVLSVSIWKTICGF